MESIGRVNVARGKDLLRGTSGALRRSLTIVLLVGATMIVAPEAQAFHESTIGSANVRTELCSGSVDVVDAGDGVKSFNETATSTDQAMEARATQETTVSGTSVLTVRTTGEMIVTATGSTGGCGDASSFLSAIPVGDDSEFTGEYFFTISGSMSFEGESEGSGEHDGCLKVDVGGGVAGEQRCDLSETDGPTIINVNESGFDEDPHLQVSANAFLAVTDASGSATATWDLTLTVFAPDACPASAPAGAGFSAAAEGCPTTPTVGFADDVGLDGLRTESSSLAFMVVLQPAQPTEVVVNVHTAEIFEHEAIAGQDYQSTQGQVAFPPGEVFALFSVPLIEDAIAEPDELFGAVLTAGSTPVTLGKSLAHAIVRDDDCALHVPSASGPNDITAPDGTAGAVCGSVFNDVIRGTNTGDLILGGAGDDVLTGRGGQDALVGGVGNDDLFGGFGLDSLSDEPSRDFLTGGPLEPRGPDDDEVFGQNGNDVIDGGAGNDSLFGGDGNDDVAGGSGVDTVDGQAGDDLLFAAERPRLPLVLNTAAYLTEATNGDVLRGGDNNDTLHGSSGDNLLFGGDGSDTIYGHAGQDRLFGEAGNDSLREGPLFSPDFVKDFLVAGSGAFDSCIATPVIDDKLGCEL